MAEIDQQQLASAIEAQHGGTATFVESVPVKEEFEGKTAWEGSVSVFDLAGHPKAKRAYAWSYELPDGKRRIFAVLGVTPINSPRDAVRAAVVAEARSR